MPLHTDYRPRDLDSVVGNRDTVQALRVHMGKKAPNRSLLFIGPSGCGKTTLAMCVAQELGAADDWNFQMLNASDFRGIDTVRDLREQSGRKPIGGARCRVWLMDECFAKGTLIQTPTGNFCIEDIYPGMSIYSLFGEDRVKRVFKNKVELERVCSVKLSSGTTLYTTMDHQFFTDKGWCSVRELTKDHLLFPFSYNIMNSINSQRKGESGEELRMVREKGAKLEEVLQQLLHRKVEELPAGNTGEDVHRRKKQENIRSTQKPKAERSRAIREAIETSFGQDEGRQESSEEPLDSREDEADQTYKRDLARLERGEGREREIDPTPDSSGHSVGMADGSSGAHRKEATWNTNELQDRHRKPNPEDRDRSGWPGTSTETQFIERRKERSDFEFIRMESVEVYQRGHNDGSFSNIISDTERDQGFVTFHDLEMCVHPSYFANGVAVHNCHKLTQDAQEAILKLLEDPPRDCWFLLATTNPEKLKVTLRRRCTEFQVSPVGDQELTQLLQRVIRRERKRVPPDVLQQLCRDSLGSPGMALNVLDKVIDLPEADMLRSAKRWAERESNVITLCRQMLACLRKKGGWKDTLGILKELQEDDPETIRRQVLEYFNKVGLDGNESAYLVMSCFRQNYYDCGRAGLYMSAYEAFMME